ncbi:sensor histidine kinase [Chrysiogenes arsenatis]|uniref:sensor histidine kinase n=1 Tax=Chrysiogenes arsenatis TaxID=309797 RepID=UPI00041DDF20|nr:ATP-binding protein [Chrysiogenes arsenatis]
MRNSDHSSFPDVALESSTAQTQGVGIAAYQAELEVQNENLRLAQRHMEQARDAFARLYNFSPNGYLTLSSSGIILQLNQTFADMLGLSISDLTYQPFVNYLSENERRIFLARYPSFFKSPRDKNIETTLRGCNGRVHVRLTGRSEFAAFFSPKRQEEGTVLLLAVNDITEQHRLDEARRDSEEKFRLIVETTTDMIFQIDHASIFTYASPATPSVIGWEVEQIVGTSFIKLIAPESLEVAMKAFAQVMEGTSIQLLELQILRSNHSTITVGVSVAPQIRNGSVIGLQGIARDISVRKKLLDDLSRSNTELEQFAYAVSHDMRQPLRMINSYLQILAKELGGDISQTARDCIHYATDGAVRMDQMIVSLLAYSRIGRKSDPIGVVSLRETLDEALTFLAPAILETQAIIEINGEFPAFTLSRDEMVRLFQNLVDNGLKYQPVGRIPHITITARESDKNWIFSVEDNGIGIDPSQAHRLFQVFSRLQSRAKYDGNGVGLAICRKIVEKHGGKIWIKSFGDGHGTTFYFTIPKTTNPVTI